MLNEEDCVVNSFPVFRTYCSITRNCTGPERNVTTNEITCCDGFAVNPEDEGTAGSSRRRRHFFRTHSSLREKGCTLSTH
jgi:hypothetical protein